ncbi:hypothetical protein GCM10008956_18300 [Deinococcus arenae]|uniref:DUF418 domain-containing protein n=1 Tax=Deinococcus arenae TaxID=1452751 RepID=A0A8H9L8C5_9DEIO|nr:DUF418 domain-containing protein [Deinococcus arenae]AWT36596.1 hypothetical protein DM785_14330 [Deinococcus actinosclerus]GGM42229.1 hypothetical protein GCM10008956_18300 [Deinococcus arenae]
MTAPEPAPVLPPDLAPPAPERAPDTGPVRDRSPLPDVLRGAALLGILIVNMQDFAGFLEWQQSGLDRAAQVVTDTLANGRFISIFAMLFGWGAAGILARRGVGVFLRRHAALLLVGALHYVLVWHGDIISNYATLALALLLVAHLSARALLVVAGALGTWWLGLGLLATAAIAGQNRPRFAFLPDLLPTYAQNVHARAAEFWPLLWEGDLFNGPWLVALFCLGAAAGKTGLLTRPAEHRPLLRRLAVGGLGVGLPLGLLLAYLNTLPSELAGTLALPVRMAGGVAGALGYVGVLGLLAASDRLGAWRLFAASGRMAMTNYLTQSVVMTLIFYPYGLGLGNWPGTGRSWGAAAGLGLSLLFGLAQLPLSAWWLARFGRGPVESLVRWVAYGASARQNRGHD